MSETETDPRSRTRRLLGCSGIVLLVLVLTLAVVEGVLRMIGAALYVPIDVELGRLDEDRPHTFRILCVGDSHTQGVDAPENMSYPRQLERLLNEGSDFTHYVVVNQGVAGYNSSQALDRLTSILDSGRERPDLVIVEVGKNNDHNFQRARFWDDETVADAPHRSQARYLLEHSKAYRLSKITRANLDAVLSGSRDPTRSRLLNRRDSELLRDWLEADYVEMIERARAAGAETVLIGYFLPIGFVLSSIEAAAEQTDARVIDVTWLNWVVAGASGLIGPTQHPNARGYGRIARSVHEGLMAQGLIPDAPGRDAHAADAQSSQGVESPDAAP